VLVPFLIGDFFDFPCGEDEVVFVLQKKVIGIAMERFILLQKFCADKSYFERDFTAASRRSISSMVL
jgi:hypothetical protein